MTITLLQALLITFFCFLGNLATPFIGVTAGYFVMGRPFIAGTIVGAILGDVQTGMLIGATINAIYLGAHAAGNVMASDVTLAGYIATALAMASKLEPTAALALAVPIGLLGVVVWNFYNGMNVFFMHLCDKYAARGEVGKMWSIGIWTPFILISILRVVPSFLIIYYGTQYSAVFFALMPDWLTKAFGVVGGMLPAVGMALLLKLMITKFSMWSFFIVGYLAAVVLHVPAVPLTLIAIAIAVIINYIKGNGAVKSDSGGGLVPLELDEEAK
jgi:PTS system mannose-specific IIC component